MTWLEWLTVTQEFWVLNPGGPKIVSPWNYFNGGSGNSVALESASGSRSGLYTVVVDARLSGNKRGKSVVIAFPHASFSMVPGHAPFL